jgi:hypothetical protein
VVRTCWRQLVILQSIVVAVSFVLQSAGAVAQAFALRDASRFQSGEAPPIGTVLAASGLVFVAVTLSFLVSNVITLATVRLVIEAATGGRPIVRECLATALRRLFPLIGWSILAGVITFAGVCACVLPVFYFIAVFTVLAPVVAVERGSAIARCFTLFNGAFGTAIGRVATILGLGFAVAMVGAMVDSIGGAVASPESAPTAAFVISGVITSGFGAVIDAARRIITDPLTVTAYADMRARIEPLSSAVLAQEIAAA